MDDTPCYLSICKVLPIVAIILTLSQLFIWLSDKCSHFLRSSMIERTDNTVKVCGQTGAIDEITTAPHKSRLCLRTKWSVWRLP